MKLRIHVGTEKTGSSFLQTVAARSRDLLREDGVAYPLPRRRRGDMLAGRISPGNAAEFQTALAAGRSDEAARWLGARCEEAAAERCGELLLSNEVIADALASEAGAETFEAALEACRAEARSAARVSSVSLLLVLREPVGQCLSLYKHRAKRGDAPPLGEWLEHGYRLPAVLAGLHRYLHGPGAAHDIAVLRYSFDGAALLDAFYGGWLGCTVPPHPPERVNASLTLSELAMIRHVRAAAPELVWELYDDFLALDREKKVEDGDEQRAAEATIARHLQDLREAWDPWNLHLPVAQRFTFESSAVAPAPTGRIVLSDAQAAVLAGLLDRSQSPGYLFRIQLRALRRGLARRLRGR